jgi:hypothetical protein
MLIAKKEHEDWLGYYGSKQKRYDAWENEWDLCTEFGEDEDCNDDLDSDVNETDGVISEIVDPNLHDEPLPPLSPCHQRSPSPPPLMSESDDVLVGSSNFVQLLVQHYGFVPPLSSNVGGIVDQKQWEKCMRAIGLRQLDGKVLSSPFDNAVFKFLMDISNGRRPGENEWDLHCKNRVTLAENGRLRDIYRLSENIILLNFSASSTSFPWILALTNAVDALYVCRLDPGFNQYDVTRCLVEQGIAFRTLLSLRIIPTVAQPLAQSLSRLVPIRLPQYQFTTKDYATYQQQRDAILASPRGRAALLRGGIIWRLARDLLSFDEALQGPSTATTIHRSGFSVEYPPSGSQLWDDDLSLEELELLSGAYCCYTGLFQQLINILLSVTDYWSI